MPKWSTAHSPPFGWYNWAANFPHPHRYFIHLNLPGKWFIQRGVRGYSDQDVWSIDMFLASIMPKMLRQLRGRIVHSTPLGLGMKQWHKKLTKMADTFEIAKKIQKNYKKHKKLRWQFEQGMQDFAFHFFDLWD